MSGAYVSDAWDEGPYFFLSYAHTPRHNSSGPDPNAGVARLYDELCEHILALTSLPDGARVGFMDQELRPGNIWPWELSRALSTCRVFVPLYSARFFTSMQCGKEWWAFSIRAANQAAREARPVEAIVPVIWTPVRASSLPEAARMIHFDHQRFGSLYATEGLYALSQVEGDKTFEAAYKRAVLGLARRIVDVAERECITPTQPPDYDSLESAFGTAFEPITGDRRLRITIIACSREDLPIGRSPAHYGQSGRDWNPYFPDCRRPLADHASDLARSLGYRPIISDFRERTVSLPSTGPSSAPELLLIDPWATMQMECRRALKRFDSADEPWIQAIILINSEDRETLNAEESLWRSVAASLGSKLSASEPLYGRARRSIRSLEDFTRTLPSIASDAVRHYLRHADTYPPDGPSIPKPRLLGPAVQSSIDIKTELPPNPPYESNSERTDD